MPTKNKANMTSYHSKLVGVSFEGRQDIICTLNGDEEVRFRREPDNAYDANAVAVDVKTDNEWKPIGYIAKDKNSELALVIDEGKEASIKISEITGGDTKHYGVNVFIAYETKRKLNRSKDAILVKDIFDNEIFYDDVAHQYTNALGEVYLSGSKFASQFEQPFDAEKISGFIAKKYKLGKVDHQKIQDMWKLKGLASASFGTAIHAALELYGTYKDLAESIDKETHIHDNGALSRAVKSFYEEYPDVSNVKYECLVVDHKMKRAGRIDRLEYQSDGSVYITDFKTNFDIEKSLDKYWLQLSFYAAILKANGLKVRGLKIYHWDDKKWSTMLGEVIDIDKMK